MESLFRNFHRLGDEFRAGRVPVCHEFQVGMDLCHGCRTVFLRKLVPEVLQECLVQVSVGFDVFCHAAWMKHVLIFLSNLPSNFCLPLNCLNPKLFSFNLKIM
uniref:(northern house mosquito) hypothetical protein n=1 Tax=Culex pipiens TaxID=7175 RepID=A0A8D8GV05_CULPI